VLAITQVCTCLCLCVCDWSSFAYANQKSIPDESDPEVTKTSCLECIGTVGGRMGLQASSMKSAAHARLAANIGNKYKKHVK
jgi:hypothetical protein